MPKDWDLRKPQIHNLYVVQRKTLREVILLMSSDYGFKAS
jgi:hypothetical protein